MNRRLIGIFVLATAMLAMVQVVGAETAHIANHVVISEIQIDSIDGAGGLDDDWIELYNPTNEDIDLAANHYRLERRTTTGSTTDVFMVIGAVAYGSYPGGTTLPSHGFYLIVRDDANTDLRAKADAIGNHTKFTLTDSNSIYLATGPVSDPPNDITDPDLVDLVGYGTASSYEGTGQAPQPPGGGSIERKAINSSTSTTMASGGDHYTWGNGEDTNNNSADSITKTTPEPQNTSSDTEDCPAQSWFLHNDVIMYKEDMSKPEGTYPSIPNANYLTWLANYAAEVDVGFPAGTWTGIITLNTAFPVGEEFEIGIGYYDGSYHGAGLQTLTGDGSKTTFSLAISGSAFTVPKDDYLCLYVHNPAGGSADLVVKTGGANSYIISPETDPGYPVPELSTLILFSIGLLALAGSVLLTRRRR